MWPFSRENQDVKNQAVEHKDKQEEKIKYLQVRYLSDVIPELSNSNLAKEVSVITLKKEAEILYVGFGFHNSSKPFIDSAPKMYGRQGDNSSADADRYLISAKTPNGNVETMSLPNLCMIRSKYYNHDLGFDKNRKNDAVFFGFKNRLPIDSERLAIEHFIDTYFPILPPTAEELEKDRQKTLAREKAEKKKKIETEQARLEEIENRNKEEQRKRDILDEEERRRLKRENEALEKRLEIQNDAERERQRIETEALTERLRIQTEALEKERALTLEILEMREKIETHDLKGTADTTGLLMELLKAKQ